MAVDAENLTLIIAMLALVLQYISLPRETHDKVSRATKRLMSSAWRVIPYAVVIGICVMSATGIVFFAIDDKPIRRLEVVMLLGHTINLGMYAHILLSGRLSQLKKQTEPSNESPA